MTSIKNDKGTKEKVVYNNGFLFLMVPVDFRIPPKLLHIQKYKNGNYDELIDETANIIIKALKKFNLKVQFKCTDGDRYLSEEHTSFFKKYIEGKSSNFIKLIQNLYFEMNLKDIIIPVGDPLHLWKALRTRLQKLPIAIFGNSSFVSDIDGVKNVLQLGNALNDFSQTGKMRDSYCLQLFTLNNVNKLFIAGKYVDAIILFPFACWIIVAYSTTIDLPFRLFLNELAFQIIYCFYENIKDLKKNGVKQKATENANIITIAEEQYIIRMLNSLVATALTLIFADYIRTDCVGTHLVENCIELARQTSNDPRWSRIISSFSHSELRKKISKKYGIRLHVQKRLNDGGCKIDQGSDAKKQPGTLFSRPKDWSIPNILQLLIGICNKDTVEALKPDLENFMNEINELGNLIDIKNYNINETANNNIIARLVSFKNNLYSDETDEDIYSEDDE